MLIMFGYKFSVHKQVAAFQQIKLATRFAIAHVLSEGPDGSVVKTSISGA